MNDLLATKPKYFRAPVARGLAESQDAARIDRTGGENGAGVIRGASLISRGEALGHDLWIDGEMLEQVAAGINGLNKGVKARFTHPGLSSDGLGKFLGRAKNASVQGDQVVGDIHFSKAGHNTPDGDLASYVMDLAEEDAESFGVSIVFEPDIGEEEYFVASNKNEDGRFESPDPDNRDHLHHARVAIMRGGGVVDDPAANPAGLFHREQQYAQEADKLLSYSLGLTQERPTLQYLGVDVDRVSQFVARFVEQNGLEIKITDRKVDPMNEDLQEDQAADAEVMDDEVQAQDKADSDNTEVVAEAIVEPSEAASEDAELSEGEKFLEAFGTRGGVWYAEGKSFEAAQTEFNQELLSENKQLQDKLAALQAAQGDETPVEFSNSDETEVKTFADVIRPNKK